VSEGATQQGKYLRCKFVRLSLEEIKEKRRAIHPVVATIAMTPKELTKNQIAAQADGRRDLRLLKVHPFCFSKATVR
jgi:hypothetical protein